MSELPDFFAGQRTPDGPRAWTEEEVRARFLGHVWHLIRWWGGHDGSNVKDQSTDERLEGLVFSLLAAIDGSAMALPRFSLTPAPHESDEQYRKDNGANWYPSDVDVAGSLHKLFYSYKPAPLKGTQ